MTTVVGRIVQPVVKIPASLQQGDTVSWVDEPFADDLGNTLSSTNFNLVYTIAGASAPVSLTAAASGVGWQTTIASAQSSRLTPAGTFWWQAQLQAVDASGNYTVARGELTVIVNLATQQAGFSGNSQAEQNLLAWQNALAALTGSAGSPPVESYRIGEREMRYRNIKEILDTIAYWNAVVISERTQNSIAQNQGNPRKLYARFPSTFTGRS